MNLTLLLRNRPRRLQSSAVKRSIRWLALVAVSLLAPSELGAIIRLPDDAPECIVWAARDLEASLKEAGVSRADADVAVLLVGNERLPAQSFRLTLENSRVRIKGSDAVGAMYGLFELAEQIANGEAKGSWANVSSTLIETTQKPLLEFRGDNPFCHEKPFLLNDVPMWKAYIDMLARCRFNVLDIHAQFQLDKIEFPNIYPRLIHLPEYPTVGDQQEQEKNLADFKAILAHAKKRGVQVGLMNYTAVTTNVEQEDLADYSAKAVSRLLQECLDLDLLGFRIGESGQPTEFFEQSYLKGVADSGRQDIRLYTRSWVATQESLEKIGARTGGKFDIEIKYNGEHLGLPYHAVHGLHGTGDRHPSFSYEGFLRSVAPYRIVWQCRAGGTHRYWAWADTEFIRRTVGSFQFGRARGFTLEPHTAYRQTKAAPYYDRPEDQKVYQYIWEKQWMWYFHWGRLSYNPALPTATIEAAFDRRFGPAGKNIYRAMQASGKILPLINAYCSKSLNHQSDSPETETGFYNTTNKYRSRKHKQPEDSLALARHRPIDRRAFAGIGQYVEKRISGEPDGRIGPARVANMLAQAADQTRQLIDKVGPLTGPSSDEWRLLKTDLLCSAASGEYYRNHILGVLHFHYAEKTGSESDFQKADQYFAEARTAWKRLAQIADPVYALLQNTVVGQDDFQWNGELKPLKEIQIEFSALRSTSKIHPTAKPLTFTPADKGRDANIRVGAVSHTIQTDNQGRELKIRCNASAEHGVKAVLLWFKKLPSQYDWQVQPMTRCNAAQFAVTLPLSEVGLLYHVEVHDNQGGALNFPPVLKERPYWVVDPWEIESAAQGGTAEREHTSSD